MNGNGASTFPTRSITFPTLAAECSDTETRSLRKITDILYGFVQNPNPGQPPLSLEELIQAIKGEDGIRNTSGAFVNQFTLFTGPTLLYQLDCFSIAPSGTLEWLYVYDALVATPGVIPPYIVPIYGDMNASVNLSSPFSVGVTVALSTAPSTLALDPGANMLVTGVKRGP